MVVRSVLTVTRYRDRRTASTSITSHTNAELACTPSSSGENLGGECHQNIKNITKTGETIKKNDD